MIVKLAEYKLINDSDKRAMGAGAIVGAGYRMHNGFNKLKKSPELLKQDVGKIRKFLIKKKIVKIRPQDLARKTLLFKMVKRHALPGLVIGASGGLFLSKLNEMNRRFGQQK